MLEAVRVERVADDADAAVHHVGGRDDVAAGGRLGERLLDQGVQRLVVDDVAVADQPVLAVAGERVQRHVADHADVREGGLHG